MKILSSESLLQLRQSGYADAQPTIRLNLKSRRHGLGQNIFGLRHFALKKESAETVLFVSHENFESPNVIAPKSAPKNSLDRALPPKPFQQQILLDHHDSAQYHEREVTGA